MRPIKIRRTRTGPAAWNKVIFDAAWPAKPTYDDLRDAQISQGFYPQGYGGPNLIEEMHDDEGIFYTRWTCAGSCE